jgi:hypothetical protein
MSARQATSAAQSRRLKKSSAASSQEQFMSQANLVLAQIALAVQELRDAVVQHNSSSD